MLHVEIFYVEDFDINVKSVKNLHVKSVKINTMSDGFNAFPPILLFLTQNRIFSGNVESFLPFFTASI